MKTYDVPICVLGSGIWHRLYENDVFTTLALGNGTFHKFTPTRTTTCTFHSWRCLTDTGAETHGVHVTFVDADCALMDAAAPSIVSTGCLGKRLNTVLRSVPVASGAVP